MLQHAQRPHQVGEQLGLQAAQLAPQLLVHLPRHKTRSSAPRRAPASPLLRRSSPGWLPPGGFGTAPRQPRGAEGLGFSSCNASKIQLIRGVVGAEGFSNPNDRDFGCHPSSAVHHTRAAGSHAAAPLRRGSVPRESRLPLPCPCRNSGRRGRGKGLPAASPRLRRGGRLPFPRRRPPSFRQDPKNQRRGAEGWASQAAARPRTPRGLVTGKLITARRVQEGTPTPTRCLRLLEKGARRGRGARGALPASAIAQHAAQEGIFSLS